MINYIRIKDKKTAFKSLTVKGCGLNVTGMIQTLEEVRALYNRPLLDLDLRCGERASGEP